MKLTNKQIKEIEMVRYFIPEEMKHVDIIENDVKKFFELIETGKHKHETANETMKPTSETTGYGALLHGLARRDINVTMYVKDFNEYREQLIEIWVEDEGFPQGIAELIIKKLQ